jgi:hypothetical protein
MLLAGASAGLFQSSGYTSWTNSFTKDSGFLSGPSWAIAYLNAAGPGSINTQTTIATSTSWNALLVAYKAAAAPAICTDSGITSTGSAQIPNGTSGLYLSPSGTLVTPDCATVQYWKPPTLTCGVPFWAPNGWTPGGGVGMMLLNCPPTTTGSPQGTAVVN